MKWILIAYLHLLSTPQAIIEVKVKHYFDSQKECYASTSGVKKTINKLLDQKHSKIRVNCIVIHKEDTKHEKHSTI